MKLDVKSFTVEEKLLLIMGMDQWRINNLGGKLPEVFLADGPSGLRKVNEKGKTIMATVMPSLAVVANTWNPELAYLDGKTIADDCIENNADVLLAPGVNMKRTPLCGRNFEYPSEDPFLSGLIGKCFIEGVQSKGIGTSLKHFLGNNREFERLAQSSEIDERTMREIYLPAFEKALEAKPWTVMCAYNPINGVWASENKKILNDLLRDELGFDGLIVSDWGAVRNIARCVKASLDLTMPYDEIRFNELVEAYKNGTLKEEEIDARVEKVLELVEKCKNATKTVTTGKSERHAIAEKIAEEGIVLLKNENGTLPIEGGSVLVAGYDAECPTICGGGSALAMTDYKYKSLKQLLCDINPELEVKDLGMFKVGKDGNANCIRHAAQVYTAAYSYDTAILCISNSSRVESEDFDRETIRLSRAKEELILGTAKMCKKVVVILYTGSAIDMSPWIDKVSAVVYAGYAGEGVNEALANILTGKCNPSGRLSETFPLSLTDTPTGEEVGNGFVERYKEGVLVGYRWYDTLGKKVLFPFGHGLSYSEVEYSDLKIEKVGKCDYEVSFNVKNLSDIPTKEVTQLYVRDVVSMVERPLKELKGFEKVSLLPGEEKSVTIKLDYRSFAFYSTALDRWHVENGDFEIHVGASSRDIRLVGKMNVELPVDEQYTVHAELCHLKRD